MKSIFKIELSRGTSESQFVNFSVETNSDMSKIILSYLDDDFKVTQVISEFSREKMIIPEDEIPYHKRLRYMHGKAPNIFYSELSDKIE